MVNWFSPFANPRSLLHTGGRFQADHTNLARKRSSMTPKAVVAAHTRPVSAANLSIVSTSDRVGEGLENRRLAKSVKKYPQITPRATRVAKTHLCAFKSVLRTAQSVPMCLKNSRKSRRPILGPDGYLAQPLQALRRLAASWGAETRLRAHRRRHLTLSPQIVCTMYHNV